MLVGCGGAGSPGASPVGQVVARPIGHTVAVGGAPGATEYWYTRTTTAARLPVPLVSVFRPGTRPVPSLSHLVWLNVRESTETWIGRDGTVRTRTIELGRQFASPADRARWVAAGQPPLPRPGGIDGIVAGASRFPPQLSSSGPDPGDGLFSVRELGSLPTAVGALRRRLERATAAVQGRLAAALAQAAANPLPGQATGSARLWTIGSPASSRATGDALGIVALLATPVPATLRAALVRVLLTLPGAVTDRVGVRDPLGRPGVAVRIGTGPGAERLVVDPHAGVVLSDSFGRTVSRTIVGQGPVGSIRALPAGLTPIPGPAEPRAIAVSPAVGGPTTIFSVTVPVTAGGPAGAQGFLTVSGPGGPGCSASLLRPPLTPASAGPGGSTYRVGPAATGRATWCPGRYQAGGPGFGVYFEVR